MVVHLQQNTIYMALSVQVKLLEEGELSENGQTPPKVWHCPRAREKIWESICAVAGTTQGPWHLEGNKFMPVRRPEKGIKRSKEARLRKALRK